MLAANETITSNKSVTFADATASNFIQRSTAETFCLSQKPCTLEMFESLEEQNKLEAFKNIINVRQDHILPIANIYITYSYIFFSNLAMTITCWC